MINKRKLDELVKLVTWEPERKCGYTFEECCKNRNYQIQVCEYVNKSWMPDLLSDYLYNHCYYDDLETVKANLKHINASMKETFFRKDWVDIPLESILEGIEKQKQAEEEEMEMLEDSENTAEYDACSDFSFD